MPKTTPQNVVYLRKHGPAPYSRLPRREVSLSDKDFGVAVFKIRSGNQASRNIGGKPEPVAYLFGEHDPERVVREYVMANPQLLESLTLNGLVERLGSHGSEFREAARRVLAETDIERRGDARA